MPRPTAPFDPARVPTKHRAADLGRHPEHRKGRQECYRLNVEEGLCSLQDRPVDVFERSPRPRELAKRDRGRRSR